jgi:hypothetical protein
MSGAVPREGGGAAEDGQAQSDTGHQERFAPELMVFACATLAGCR